MAAIQLEALLTAKDQASGKIQNFQMSLGKLSAAVGIGTVAAGAFDKAMGFVTDTVKDSINAAIDAEKSQVKVDTILKKLNGSYAKNAEVVAKASNAALKLGFDDEDAAESMAKLMGITKNSEDANTALATAMDLARYKGIDLTSSTQALIRAYGGSTKELKMLGVEVKDGVSGMDALYAITDKTAGQARAFADTTAGAQEKFKMAMENTQEAIGGMVLPVITNFFNRVSAFVSSDRFQGWIKAVGDFLSNVIAPIIRDSVVPAFNAMKAAIEPHLPLLGGFIKIVGGVAGTALIGALTVASIAVRALAVAFDFVLDQIQKVIDAVKSVINWFSTAANKFNEFKGKVGGAISGGASNVGNFFSGLFGHASGGLVQAGHPTLVGEAGTELFIPSTSGRVIPNDELGGRSVTVHFHNPVVQSQAQFDELVKVIRKTLAEDNRLSRLGAI